MHHDFVKKDPNYLRKMLAFRTELKISEYNQYSVLSVQIISGTDFA
jgi:hypothetical protein